MKIQITISTEIGTYLGLPMDITRDQYDVILQKTSKYYEEGGFEMLIEDGSRIVISPDLVKKSVLKINILEDVQE